MSVFIDAQSRLQHHQENLALNCPHCQVLSHVSPMAVPQYDQLLNYRPKQVGIVFRCDSCNAPVFLKFNVKMYAASRVELNSTFVELERQREKFSFTYLPEDVEQLFKEALSCYTAACYNAFASMCRRTAQLTFAELGEAGKLRMFDELTRIRDMADIDADTHAVVKKVIFGNETDPKPALPMLDHYQAGVLLEVMKDLLSQAYVRKGRLQQAMAMRRFFIDENENKVTPIAKMGKLGA